MKALEGRRRPQPVVQADELPAARPAALSPHEGGGKLQRVPGPERVDGEQAERRGRDVVARLHDVGRVEGVGERGKDLSGLLRDERSLPAQPVHGAAVCQGRAVSEATGRSARERVDRRPRRRQEGADGIGVLVRHAHDQDAGGVRRPVRADVCEIEVERDEDAVSASCRFAQREESFSSEVGGIGDRGSDVFGLQGGVLSEDVSVGHPSGQIVQDDGDWDPRTADAGHPMTHGRVGGDAFVPVHVRLLWSALCAESMRLQSITGSAWIFGVVRGVSPCIHGRDRSAW